MFYVYAHCDKDGLVKYIGKGSGVRAWRMYNRPAYWSVAFPNGRPSVVKILEDGITVEIEAYRRERFWINKLKNEGHPIVNKDIAKPWLGKSRDPELMKKMSIASQSAESKEKRYAGRKGRQLSQSHRDAIMASSKKKPVICSDGRKFESINSAAREFKVSCGKISEAVNGKRKSVLGLTFKFED